MTIAPGYGELHQAVDRLSPGQAEALYVVVESMLGVSEQAPPGPGAADASRVSHRFSFTGAGSGPADLAERAEGYLRANPFGHPAP